MASQEEVTRCRPGRSGHEGESGIGHRLHRRVQEDVATRRVWKEVGALEYVECIADEMDIKELPFYAKRVIFGGFTTVGRDVGKYGTSNLLA